MVVVGANARNIGDRGNGRVFRRAAASNLQRGAADDQNKGIDQQDAKRQGQRHPVGDVVVARGVPTAPALRTTYAVVNETNSITTDDSASNKPSR